VNPTFTYDAASNVMVVRVALDLSRDLQLRFNRRFTGRTPVEVGGWIGFAFGNNTESGSHDLKLVIDAESMSFRFPDYSSFQLPRELLLRMAAANSVAGSWDDVTFSMDERLKAGIRRFVAAIDPPNLEELDQPRLEHWSVGRTVDYINALLEANPGGPCNRTRLAIENNEVHVYSRRCGGAFDTEDMFAPAGRLQRRGLFLINGNISIDCTARESCAETRRRESARDPWTRSDNKWTWVRLETGSGNAESGEKIRNALEYLVMALRESQ
jgi:hypothetical protein